MRTILLMFLCAFAFGCSAQNSTQATPVPEMKPQDLTLLPKLIMAGVSEKAATRALISYDVHANQIKRADYFVIVDMTLPSSEERFYLVEKATGDVVKMGVAHGEGSDPQNTGYAKYFSNVPNSKMTSLGAYLIQERYNGKHGPSLRMDGLDDTNSNVRDRDIVLHPAAYVHNDSADKQGRSWGCPAVSQDSIKTILSELEGGAFMYIYGENARTAFEEAADMAYWQTVPKSQWPHESEE